MRRTIVTFVLLVIVALFLVASATNVNAQGGGQATINRDPLNLRASPSVHAAVLVALRYHSQYPALARTVSSYWYKLNVDGTVGWVCARYVKLSVSEQALVADSSVVNEDCNGVTKTVTVAATLAPSRTPVPLSPQYRYKAIRVGAYPDIHFQVIDKQTGAALFTTHAEFSSPNDVKTGGFCPGFDRFVAVYHYSSYSWAGVWEVPSGRFLYSKVVANVWMYTYSWACTQ